MYSFHSLIMDLYTQVGKTYFISAFYTVVIEMHFSRFTGALWVPFYKFLLKEKVHFEKYVYLLFIKS